MAELQTSHDEVLKQLEASDKPSKEEQKKAFQEAFSNLRRIEVMHGKDSQEYAGALSEYMNLKNKIIKEYSLIINQSESAILGMKDPNSFENKRYEQMSVEEAKRALENLNKKFKGLPTWTYTEMVNNTVSTSFPNCENDVTSQRIARTAQEALIKKIVGENGFNSEVVVGFDNEKGNYLIRIGDVENDLKDANRTISSGSKEAQMNSKVIANYLKYLSDSVGGNITAFQNLFFQKFGETKAKELIELWKSKADTTAKKELATTSFGSVVENISKIDVNNIEENYKLLIGLSENDLKKLGQKLTESKDGFKALVKVYNNPEAQKQSPEACKAIGEFLQLKDVTIFERLLPTEDFWKGRFPKLIEKIGLKDSTKISFFEQELKSILDFSNRTLDQKEINKKINDLLKKTFGEEKKIDPSITSEIINFINLMNAFDATKKKEEVENKINSGTVGAQSSEFDEAFVTAQAAQAKIKVEKYNNYSEFKKVSEEINSNLTKKIESLTPEISSVLLDPSTDVKKLKDYIGRLSIKPLLEILPKLSGTKITFEMIDRSLTDSPDCLAIIEAFPKEFYDNDLMSFNSFVLFENPKKNGNSILNISSIKNILSKTPHFLKKVLLKKIFILADENVKISLSKDFIQLGQLTEDDIPLNILDIDKTNILGIDENKKDMLLKLGNTPDINKNIEYLLDGDEKVIQEKLDSNEIRITNFAGLNEYIEKNGVENIRQDLLEKIILKKSIVSYPSIIWIAQENEEFAKKIMSIDARVTLYLNLEKWPGRNFSEAFIKGCKNLSFDNKQKALDAYIFSSLKDLTTLFRGFSETEKTLFLSYAVQKNIGNCIEGAKEEFVSNEDIKQIQGISSIIKAFSNQSEKIDSIVDKYTRVNELGKGEVFETRAKEVIEKYNIKGEGAAELLEILKKKDWFKVRLADVIKIFGSNSKDFEQFVKEISEIEIKVEEKKIEKLSGLNKLENKPTGRIGELYAQDTDGKWKINHTKLKEDYYAYLVLRSKEKKDDELPEAFNQRMLKEYIATLGNSEDTSNFEEIIKSSQIIQEKIYIRDHTPESIQAAVEGRFDTLYGTYLQKTYSLPANVVPGLENRSVLQSKNGALPIVETSSGERYLESPSVGKIPLSSSEAAEVKDNPEAQERLIKAYDFICNTLKLEKIWAYRNIIIDAAKNVSTSFIDFNKNEEFWSQSSLQKFMILVGKSVGTFKQPVSTLIGKPFDEIKQNLLSKNGAVTVKGGTEDTDGRGEIEKTFIKAFDPNRDTSKTQFLLEQAFKDSNLNS